MDIFFYIKCSDHYTQNDQNHIKQLEKIFDNILYKKNMEIFFLKLFLIYQI